MTSAPNAHEPLSGRGLLVRWANAQDHWIRELTAWIIEHNAEPNADLLHQAYEHMLTEKSLAEGERRAGPLLVEQVGSGGAEPPLTLVSLDSIKNVNALADGQTINFNRNLTVLFGRNGSGKTGYARILKRISSVRREQKILPDITAATPTQEPPEARVHYRFGPDEATLLWTGLAGVAPLTAIDVFDSQEALIHVDGDLTYVYAPTDVAMFRYLSAAIDAIRARLEDSRRERAPGTNVFTSHFKRDLSFYPLIDTLGATTDVSAIRQLADVSPEEENGLSGLRETTVALGATEVQAHLRSAQTDLELCSLAISVANRLKAFDASTYGAALEHLNEATQRQDALTRGSFANDSIPGLMTPPWRGFILAGEHYTQAFEQPPYPSPGKPCIYCRQALMTPAVETVGKYRALCNDDHEDDLAHARSDFEAATRNIIAVELGALDDAIRAAVSHSTNEEAQPEHLHSARLVSQTARTIRDQIGSRLQVREGTAGELENAFARLQTAEAMFRERTSGLKGRTAERAAKRLEVTRRLDLLEARLTLRNLLPSIELFVERSKWASLSESVLKRLKTTAKTLTETAKQASERLVNQNFEKHFREECGILRAPSVNLDFKGQKGAAARRKQLRSEYRLTETLSEGEQKVIALADFLAEARLRATNAPIVFDDPVTSLDYERVQEVASRIAQLSRQRQVVVFTHNIWLAVELLDRFRDHRESCSYYDVRALDGKRGIVSGGTHPRSDSIADLRKRINTAITEARKTSTDVQDALIARGYSCLRALCEVAVESELFKEIIRRYEPNVRLTNLPKIKPLALKAAADVIHPIYEDTCRYIDAHSQPMEHLNIVRTVDELENDFKSVLEAIEVYRQATA